MNHLLVTREQLQQLVHLARQDAPHETCGILLGRDTTLHTIIPARNIASEPTHTYHIEDRAVTDAFKQANRDGMTVIGFYHSHPNSDHIPSQTDVRLATYPDAAYLIISLKGSSPEVAAWSICNNQVNPITITVGLGSTPINNAERDFSPAQKGAIICAAIIAFIFALILSVTLLPPAPVIVTPMP